MYFITGIIQSCKAIGYNLFKSNVKNTFIFYEARKSTSNAVAFNKPNIVRSFNKKKKSQQELRKKIKILDGRYFLAAIPVISFGLGTWQIKRKIEKEADIKDLEEYSHLPPIELPQNLEDLKNMEFRQVRIKGTFDHSRELYIGPRNLIKPNAKGYQGSSLISTTRFSGFLVITPFKLSGRDETILVNRGWVHKDKKSPKTRLAGQITGEVEIVGYVRGSEKRKPLGMKNQPGKGIWVYRDLDHMSAIAGSYPLMVDALLSSTIPDGPIGGQTNVNIPNNHLEYIITWYGLCIATSYMWYMRYVK